ncbi:MAG: 50S ribosomal protein L3 [Candidatus Aureabacteria bacterium]|nr:50S ribosomal protein L3 [Candidatus Auribacterota bacterium]
MRMSLFGRKIGMTQIFSEKGNVLPVTVLEVGPCMVVQVKTPEKNSYSAVQLGFGDVKERRVTKPLRGHFKKAGVAPKAILAETRLVPGEEKNYQAGQEIKADIFKKGDRVDVTGISIGRGFAGVMKRHGFHGHKASHGTHESKRGMGASGACATPSRVYKGRKMAGQMGNTRVTVMNLEVVDVRPEKNIILVKGAVPGWKTGFLQIKTSVKTKKTKKK